MQRLDPEKSVIEWTAELEEPLWAPPPGKKPVVSAKVLAEELAMFKRAQKILN